VGGDVEYKGNQAPDVLDNGNLGVDEGDGGGLKRVVNIKEGRRRRSNVNMMRRRWLSREGGELKLEGGQDGLLMLCHGLDNGGGVHT
jgi:hypothetical protein